MGFWHMSSSEIEEIYSNAETISKFVYDPKNFELKKIGECYNFFSKYVSFEVVKDYLKEIESVFPREELLKYKPIQKKVPQSEFSAVEEKKLENILKEAFHWKLFKSLFPNN